MTIKYTSKPLLPNERISAIHSRWNRCLTEHSDSPFRFVPCVWRAWPRTYQKYGSCQQWLDNVRKLSDFPKLGCSNPLIQFFVYDLSQCIFKILEHFFGHWIHETLVICLSDVFLYGQITAVTVFLTNFIHFPNNAWNKYALDKIESQFFAVLMLNVAGFILLGCTQHRCLGLGLADVLALGPIGLAVSHYVQRQ